MRNLMCLSTIILIVCAVVHSDIVYPDADMTTVPSGSYPSSSYIEVCHRPAHGHPDTRGNILFDLSSYYGSIAESAILNINVFYKSGCGLPTTFYTYAATEIWDESWSGAHLSHGTTDWGTFSLNDLGWYQLDVTDLVNAWLSQSIDNYGLVFECINSNQAEHRFYSINADSTDLHPYLLISLPSELGCASWAGIKSSYQ